jgi:hypothetical protein
MMVADGVHQQPQGPPAQLTEVLPDRGQRRAEERGFRDVVEPDHADVLGHPPALLAERAQQAQRHVVVGAEHGGHLGPPGQLQADLVAGPGRPVAGQHLGLLGAGLGQGLRPAAGPLPGVQPGAGPAHVVHGAVAEVEQVAGGPGGARGVVD